MPIPSKRLKTEHPEENNSPTPPSQNVKDSDGGQWHTDLQIHTSDTPTNIGMARDADVIPISKPQLLWEIKNKEGYSPQKLYHPYDVSFLWNSRVVVVEGFWPYSRIQLLDLQGKSIMSLAQGDILPFGVTVDNEGYMAVTDHKDRTVKFYTPDGNTALSWQQHKFDWPDGIATTIDGKYLVADWSKGHVSMHDIDGVAIRSYSTISEGSERSCPMHIAVDRHHRTLITDTFDRTVKIFDQAGKLLLKFGDCNGNAGQNGTSQKITDPRGICIDAMNNIIVADWGTNCITKFSPDGEYIETILSSDDGENKVRYPWGVAVTDTGLLLVSEQKLDKKDPRLKLFQSS